MYHRSQKSKLLKVYVILLITASQTVARQLTRLWKAMLGCPLRRHGSDVVTITAKSNGMLAGNRATKCRRLGVGIRMLSVYTGSWCRLRVCFRDERFVSMAAVDLWRSLVVAACPRIGVYVRIHCDNVWSCIGGPIAVVLSGNRFRGAVAWRRPPGDVICR